MLKHDSPNLPNKPPKKKKKENFFSKWLASSVDKIFSDPGKSLTELPPITKGEFEQLLDRVNVLRRSLHSEILVHPVTDNLGGPRYSAVQADKYLNMMIDNIKHEMEEYGYVVDNN